MRIRRIGWAVLVGSLLVGCGSKRKETATKTVGPATLAKVGSELISAQDLADRVNELAVYTRRQYKARQDLKEQLLEQLVDEELLVSEARRRKLDQDPTIRRLMRQHLAQRLREVLTDGITMASITDQEIEEFYRTHPERYRTQLRLRVRQIVVATEDQARKVHAEVERSGKTESGFIALVKKHTLDGSTRGEGGDSGEFSGSTPSVPRPLYDAILAMTESGEVSEPVRTPRGWHIVRLTYKHPQRVFALDEVRDQVRIAAMLAKREAVQKKLLEDLRAKAGVKLFPAALARVPIELKPRKGEPDMDKPPPGRAGPASAPTKHGPGAPAAPAHQHRQDDE